MGKSRSKRRKARAHRKQEQQHEQDQNGGQGNERVQEHEQDPGRLIDQGEIQGQSSESIDEFSSFIRREMNNLINFISKQFGLLDVLESTYLRASFSHPR